MATAEPCRSSTARRSVNTYMASSTSSPSGMPAMPATPRDNSGADWIFSQPVRLFEHHRLREIHGIRERMPDAAAEPKEADRKQRRHRDVGKVGAVRLAVAVDQAVGDGDPARYREAAEGEQDQAMAPRRRGCQPSAGSQPLPEMSHFAAEFYESCAGRAGRF